MLNFKCKKIIKLTAFSFFVGALAGCGNTLLDGSSQNKLQESFKIMKDDLSDNKQKVKFEVAFNILNIHLYDQVKKGQNENNLRMELFNGKDARALVETARSYEQKMVDQISEEIKGYDRCYEVQKNGLKIDFARIRSSSVKPEERVELSFDLHNDTPYPISQIQANVTLQIFGAPEMEKLFADRDQVNCIASKVIKSGSMGTMTCNLAYNMGSVRYEGPAKDVQNFVFEIVDTDSTPMNDQDDQNTMAYCKEHRDQLKKNMDLYLNDLESLMGF